MTSYIYVTYCKKTLKPYVGQHTWDGIGKDVNYYGSGVSFLKALKEKGKENFSNHVIEYCDSVKELNDKEQYWITELDSMSPNGYNLIHGGLRVKGCRHSLETRGRMSLAAKGKPPMSEETRARMALAKRGGKLTKEHRKNIGLAGKGRKQKIVLCPHCDKEGATPIMYRWHFDNCPHQPNA